jgi:hypothetical protein
VAPRESRGRRGVGQDVAGEEHDRVASTGARVEGRRMAERQMRRQEAALEQQVWFWNHRCVGRCRMIENVR